MKFMHRVAQKQIDPFYRRAASGGALALEPPRVHWIGPEQGRILEKIHTNLNTQFQQKKKNLTGD